MAATAAEAAWRGTGPALEPWRPDHFAYKFSMHDITRVGRTNSENEAVRVCVCMNVSILFWQTMCMWPMCM